MAIASNRPLAVVTGASSGIGYELARECAENGFDLLVCAEDAGIHDAARRLAAAANVAVEAKQADLATYDGVEELARTIEGGGRPVEALLLNAGVGVGGAFVDTDLEAELRMIALNVTSVVHLAKRVLPAMLRRGKGRILVTSSIAGTAPAPYHLVYGATKAFDLSFAEGLREELKDKGITVTALQPGATDTNFFERADMTDTKVGQSKKDDPADVAKEGFKAMMAGKDSVVAGGLKAKLQGYANEVLPEAVKAKAQAKQTEPGSGHK